MKYIKKYVRYIQIIVFILLLAAMSCCMTICPAYLICTLIMTKGFAIIAFLEICGKCLLLYFVFALLAVVQGSFIWKD